MALKCYRKPGETGSQVYYARLEDNTTFQENGADAKFNFTEASAIEAGVGPETIIARRTKRAPAAPVPHVATPPDHFGEPVKRGPGRPPKDG